LWGEGGGVRKEELMDIVSQGQCSETWGQGRANSGLAGELRTQNPELRTLNPGLRPVSPEFHES